MTPNDQEHPESTNMSESNTPNTTPPESHPADSLPSDAVETDSVPLFEPSTGERTGEGAEEYLLDHNYDGIQEYDNPLPSWWKAVFNVTIAFSLFYPFFANSTVDEYNEVAAAEAQRLADELAKLEISDEVIQGIMGQPEVMQVMGKTFQSNCSTCHGKQAEGGAGPNLTDSHWLHGGSLVEIFTVIRNGVPGKEMQPWLETLGPGGVLQMAAYVGSLRDTHVAGGKSPQGKLYEPK